MTYVVAWKTNTTFYISTDSAVTMRGLGVKQSRQESTFGEQHFSQPGIKVEEGAFKILRVKGRFLCGLAGEAILGYKVIDAFRQEMDNGDLSIKEIFGLSLFKVLNNENKHKIKLVLGGMDGDKPFLLSYNSDSKMSVRDDEEIVQLGVIRSLQSDFVQIIESLLQGVIEAAKRGIPEHYFLVFVITCIQQHLIHNKLLPSGVGGVVTGAKVNCNGIHWPDDTMYLPHGEKKDGINPILVIYRYDGVIVKPVKAQETFGFFNSPSEFSVEFIRDEVKKLKFRDGDIKVKFIVFYSMLRPNAYILDLSANNTEQWFSMSILEDNTLEMAIKPKLAAKLGEVVPENFVGFIGDS